METNDITFESLQRQAIKSAYDLKEKHRKSIREIIDSILRTCLYASEAGDFEKEFIPRDFSSCNFRALKVESIKEIKKILEEKNFKVKLKSIRGKDQRIIISWKLPIHRNTGKSGWFSS